MCFKEEKKKKLVDLSFAKKLSNEKFMPSKFIFKVKKHYVHMFVCKYYFGF